MNASSARDARLAALRAEISAIECAGFSGGGRSCLGFGIPEVDARLTGGGLAAGLHEAAPAAPSPSDEAAATLFLAALGARFSRQGEGKGQVLWALSRRDLFAPGIAQAGLTPDRVLYAECRNDEEVLAVMEEGLRHGSLAAVIGEAGRADMTAVRRLQLAADPLEVPSAALTRWRIACAPSAPLPFAAGSEDGIGRARWQVALVRQRGGPPHDWLLEAPDAEARLALAARSGDRPDQAVRAPGGIAADRAAAA
jgi:protein ImuA